MKKYLIFIVFVCLSLSVYAEDEHILNGTWHTQSLYEYITSEPISSIDFDRRSLKHIYSGGIGIDIGSDGGGWYLDDVRAWEISQVETQGDDRFLLYYGVDGYHQGLILVSLINENSIFVTNVTSENQDYGFEKPLFRSSGPAKIPPQYGVVNDNRIRLRTEPNLECDTWGFLNTGDEVVIIDKSVKTQQIGDMEDYWYKVQTANYPDSWMYGAFITIIE